jgi:CheY-like chemotaxis protein
VLLLTALAVLAALLVWGGTRWRAALRARDRAERRRAAVWAATGEALVLVGADGTIREVNPGAARLLGDGALAPGHSLADRVAVASRGAFAEALATALREGRRDGVALLAHGPDGVARECEATFARAGLGPTAVVVVALRPRLPRRNGRHGAAPLDAVGQEAHGLAHEFNNLLTTISGRLELAGHGVTPGTTAASDLDEARHAVARAAALSRRLLELSRAQALAPRVIDTNLFLADLEPALKGGPAGPTGVALALDADAGSVNVDPARLQEALRALVLRAGRAGGPGTRVVVRTVRARRPTGPSPAHSAEWLAIEVTDDAPALPDPARSQLAGETAEPVDPELAAIASAAAFVRQSGGVFEVVGAGPRGTTFRLLFPRVAGESLPSPVGRLGEGPRGRPPTVLIVEDEESVRSFVRIVLEREGFRVLQATHGVEALSLLDDPRVTTDVLLTDVMMPQMGGRELAERVLAVQPDVRVVFMSGYVSDKSLLTGVAERQAAFLQKPFAIEDLVRAVRTAALPS